MRRVLTTTVCAVALAVGCSIAPAFADVNCNVTYSNGDHVQYKFAGQGNDDLIEAEFSKNGQLYPSHRPIWHMVGGKDTITMTPQENPDYALVVTVSAAGDRQPAMLLHTGRTLATGFCELVNAAPAPTQAYTPPAPATPAPTTNFGKLPTGVNVVQLKHGDGEQYIETSIATVPHIWGILDTGATLVSIPEDVAEKMVAAGYAHWTGESGEATIADGSKRVSRVFVIHDFTIGNQTAHNVLAGTSPVGSPYLVGMSALKEFGAFKIDVAAGTITFG